MKKIFSALVCCSFAVLLSGCGGSGEGSVAEDADQTAIEEYQANLAASQEELGAPMPDDGKK